LFPFNSARGRRSVQPSAGARSTVVHEPNCARLSITFLHLFCTGRRTHAPGAMKRIPPLLALAFAVVCVVWGSTYFAIRVALEAFPPFLIGAIRFLVAGAVLLAVARARGERLPDRGQWKWAAITAALFFVVGNGFVNVAEKSVSSGLASVVVA